MKKILLILTIFAFSLILTSPSYAHNQGIKLKRGFINILTCPLEIPKQTAIYLKKGTEKTQHTPVWIFSGFIKGIANTMGRAGSGLWDVVTFNIDMPENFGSIIQPEYVFGEDEAPVEKAAEKTKE